VLLMATSALAIERLTRSDRAEASTRGLVTVFESRASATDSGSLDKNSSVSQSARTRLLQLASRIAGT